MEKLIVMLGVFNPVTKAHFLMMQNAIDKVGAEEGLMVASSEAYLKKKTSLKKSTPFVLSKSLREEMLKSLHNEDTRINFWGYELGGVNPDSSKTIKKIMKQYPSHQIYFLCGADKVRSLHKWNDFEELLSQINIIVYKREDVDILEVIENDKILTKYKEHIVIVDPIEGIEGISSTLVRENFFAKEDYSSLLNIGPYEIMKQLNPEDFKELTFEEKIANTLKYGGMRAGYMVRQMVYNDNRERFTNWDSEMFGDRNHKIIDTKVYKDEFKVISHNNYETTYDCFNEDAVDVAYDLVKSGLKPAILNLASNYRPCGGYDDYKSAQEESLCFSSTLSQSLYQFGKPEAKGVIDANIPNLISGVYPLNINFGGIYSPDVCFFRNNKYKNFSLREEIFECGVITVASLSNRIKKNWINEEAIYFNTDGTLTAEGVEIEKNKIRTIYRIGLDNNNDSLVLGAFGCGVFRLLPEEVSQLFMDVLNEPEFKNKYKRVVFAILEGKKRGEVTGEEGKFKSFYDIWK